jgi:23S rRNA (uracil1939-C5)-methyltransferase
MKRGDVLQLSIDRITPAGDGLGYSHGREIAVRGAVPGDEVTVRIHAKRKGRVEAEVVSFERFGLQRQEASCQHFGVCGGCRWQDLSYADQLRLKSRMVADAIESDASTTFDQAPILASETDLFYRNKMEFSFGVDRDGQRLLGLHVRGRYNRVFDVISCKLQSEISNQIVAAVRRHADALAIPIYDLHSHEGVLRFLVIRDTKARGEVLVNLVVADYPNEAVKQLVDLVVGEISAISTFVVTLHQGKAQVALGQTEFALKGTGAIVETCAGLDFEISSRSFFQTNPIQAGNLYALIGSLAGDIGGKEILDLYCGVGAISLCLARSAGFVTGVELEEDAVSNARENAERNGISNCEFISGPAEEVLQGLQSTGRRFDLIVADPPRAGVHERSLSAIVDLHPATILYVSCNPVALGRDMQYLQAAGYGVEEIHPVDMFPQTPHCEAVARLRLES